MSKEHTNNRQEPVDKIGLVDSNKGHNKMEELCALMGIDASQVDTSKGTTRTKTREILNNSDALKEKSRLATIEVNEQEGTNISFACVVRKGSLKDANGKVKKDKNGDSIPRYEPAMKKGLFVIDEVKEGDNTFFQVTRALQYTETFKVADYNELS